MCFAILLITMHAEGAPRKNPEPLELMITVIHTLLPSPSFNPMRALMKVREPYIIMY